MTGNPQTPAAGEVRCLRCMQPIPHDAKRCPNCRTPRPGGRGLPIFLAICGLLALVFLVYVMVDAMHQEEQDNPSSTTQSQPDKRPPLNK